MGSYLIFDRKRSRVVAELVKSQGTERRIWVGSGDYFIKKRLPHGILLTKVTLARGAVKAIEDGQMSTVPYDEDVTKGYDGKVFRPTWRYGAPPIIGTAFTLRRTEFTTGLFHPTGWGISDGVTLYSSLFMWLLLSPNIIAKVRLLHGDRWAWSIEGNFFYSFLGRVVQSNGQTAKRSTLSVGLGSYLSGYLGRHVLATLSGGWTMHSGPSVTASLVVDDKPYDILVAEDESHSGQVGLGLHVLLSETDYVYLSANYATRVQLGIGNLQLSTDAFKLSGALIYAHAWSTFRLAIGALVVDHGLYSVPMLPYIDLWWRW